MPLNKEQLLAVRSQADRILCLAGAGAGKSATMLERISRLVSKGVEPASILALTFTNAAAAEMKGRYEVKHIGEEVPEFRTFHSFCYSVVCKDAAVRAALGYENVPGIASEEQAKAIADKAKLQCNITISNDRLQNRTDLSKKEQFQAELYDKAVNRLMRAENVITFDELNSRVAELFASGNTSTTPYKDQYKYIFVDEFQDTDNFQIKFLNSFPNTNFYFCGDCLQNIYSFRGTSNEYIKALANTPGWHKIKLFTNYRSTNQICNYANEFSEKYADASYRIAMQGTRDGEKVITKRVDGPARYDAINPNDVDDVLTELSKLSGTSAILCRTNKEVYAVTAQLKAQGVDFATSKDTKIQKLIECAISDSYTVGYLAAQLPTQKYGEYIRLSTQSGGMELAEFIKRYGSLSQIREAMRQIDNIKTIASSNSSTDSKISEFFKETGISVKNTGAQYIGGSFLKYLQEHLPEASSSELYVGTIHSVKGLEYDNVFVMNVGSYNFKLTTEEMKNLFYVAITRAKNRLYVYKLFE